MKLSTLFKARDATDAVLRRVFKALELEFVSLLERLKRERNISDVQFDDLELSRNMLLEALYQVERNCPCGARPESLNTHPHVTGCVVGRALELERKASSKRPGRVWAQEIVYYKVSAPVTLKGPDVDLTFKGARDISLHVVAGKRRRAGK